MVRIWGADFGGKRSFCGRAVTSVKPAQRDDADASSCSIESIAG
ncbi:hypothetical protein WQQ_11460 [Hydrocarboniphaga effusa AP103]|uniref:Uncharacterized protein n=1 Tax=Hydrocarboniphaga effusa AP103 TaxID=1172194 RepID=I7ZGK1_9GAMM|nr:hypothetical protein WQQ_11460 [Hydrocarboniphaga effusa AP103]